MQAGAFLAISVFSALILLDKRENTSCVALERAGSIIASIGGAYLLAVLFGAAAPTTAEWVGTAFLVAAVVTLTVAPRLAAKRAAAA